jgi:hypothetical protein
MPDMTGVASQSPVPQTIDASAWIIAMVGVMPEQMVKASEVGTHTASMFTMPVAVAEQPRTVVQVMVYSQWSPTIWMPDMIGVASHTPVPQVTNPSAMIIVAVGVTPEQMAKGVEVGTQGVSMFTMPVAVAEQPFAVVQVMVYSQWSPTMWIPDMTGVVSQTPVPQETAPLARIIAAVGVTPEQMMKGVEVGVHGVWMFTMPVPVAGPHSDWHVMVYSK